MCLAKKSKLQTHRKVCNSWSTIQKDENDNFTQRKALFDELLSLAGKVL
jgi:alkylated DNA nucleotide flippase Atl1